MIVWCRGLHLLAPHLFAGAAVPECSLGAEGSIAEPGAGAVPTTPEVPKKDIRARILSLSLAAHDPPTRVQGAPSCSSTL